MELSRAHRARIGAHPLFSNLDEHKLASIVASATLRRLTKNELVFERGRKSKELAFVVSGRLDVRTLDEAGNETVLRSLGPNAVVGVSLAYGAVPTADVVAARASRVAIIPGSVAKRTLLSSPEATFAAVVHMANLVGELSEEIEELRVSQLPERVWLRLRRLGRGRREVFVTHEEIARQVGASRANVSRALGRLEQSGRLRRHRGRIELCGS